MKRCGEALKIAIDYMDVDDVSAEVGCWAFFFGGFYFSECTNVSVPFLLKKKKKIAVGSFRFDASLFKTKILIL